ncbi:hypothetical protein Goshw_022973, partial [Gossypium schwendimanii]|nr:hypothetical protein [Gossypium schwendimanii]
VWLIYAGNEKYEVNCGLDNKHVVDLLNSSCSNKKWNLSRIPCKHAISCMQLLADVASAIITVRPPSLGPIMEKLSLSPEKYGSGRQF